MNVFLLRNWSEVEVSPIPLGWLPKRRQEREFQIDLSQSDRAELRQRKWPIKAALFKPTEFLPL